MDKPRPSQDALDVRSKLLALHAAGQWGGTAALSTFVKSPSSILTLSRGAHEQVRPPAARDGGWALPPCTFRISLSLLHVESLYLSLSISLSLFRSLSLSESWRTLLSGSFLHMPSLPLSLPRPPPY